MGFAAAKQEIGAAPVKVGHISKAVYGLGLAVLNCFGIRLPPYIFIFQYPDLSDPILLRVPLSFSFFIRPKTAFLPIFNLFASS